MAALPNREGSPTRTSATACVGVGALADPTSAAALFECREIAALLGLSPATAARAPCGGGAWASPACGGRGAACGGSTAAACGGGPGGDGEAVESYLLRLLRDEDLEKMGVPLGSRRRLSVALLTY